jgi:hypothetical protein
MSLQLGPRRVVAADGAEWTVGRIWLTRRFGWTRKRRDLPAKGLSNLGQGLGGVDFGEQGVLVIVAVVAAILILIPLLFFGIELIVLGVLLAAGIVARVLLRRPWVIEARSSDPLSPGRQLEWRVTGWRKSGKLIDQVISDLAAGREPPQNTPPL